MAFPEWDALWSDDGDDGQLSWKSLCISEHKPRRLVTYDAFDMAAAAGREALRQAELSRRRMSSVAYPAISPPPKPEKELHSSSQWVFPEQRVTEVRRESWPPTPKATPNRARPASPQLYERAVTKNEPRHHEAALAAVTSHAEEWKAKALALEHRVQALTEQLADASPHHELEQLQEKYQQLQATIATQATELTQTRAEAVNEKKRSAVFESQVQGLRQSLAETERKLQASTDAAAMELSTTRTKLESVQFALDECKNQLSHATVELDRVRKDYTKVVFELTQLQRGAATQTETWKSANQIALLTQERDDLALQLRHATALHSRHHTELAAKEMQYAAQIERLQAASRAALEQRQYEPVPVATRASTDLNLFPNALHFPDAIAVAPPHSTGRTFEPETRRSAQREPPPLEPSHPRPTASPTRDRPQRRSGPVSLAELGFGDRRPPPVASSKAELNGSANVRSLLHHHAAGDDSDAVRQRGIIDMELSAPYATEKQSLQNDVMFKRELERQLLQLNMEKEQLQAEYAKLEQTAFKTIDARRRKSSLEGKMSGLDKTINQLRMRLR
ncbi:hypothetical protein ACHHYP_09659 [Achlya hypogyna]|uniref:Uncharacterized protein n=1 Tax=Achlya hypogyna TaxID=1202772 RepID=A0A1V9YMP8_ACHHY|nr:hypothetical protein ACHHYP_09659 [Achlya hypogyna]